jgi:hypothetical protein
METAVVTTNMLYEFLKEFKTEVYSRFDQVDKRMDRFETRMDAMENRMDARMDRLENNQKSDHELLMDLWQSRDKVTVNFSRTFTFVNAFISGVVATMVTIFIKR